MRTLKKAMKSSCQKRAGKGDEAAVPERVYESDCWQAGLLERGSWLCDGVELGNERSVYTPLEFPQQGRDEECGYP